MITQFRMQLQLDTETVEYLEHLCQYEPQSLDECFTDREPSINFTVKFPNDYQMDIKCCGVDYEEGGSNTAWTEAVLFNENGCEVGFTEPEDSILGEFWIERDNINYTVEVVANPDLKRSKTYVADLTEHQHVCLIYGSDNTFCGVLKVYGDMPTAKDIAEIRDSSRFNQLIVHGEPYALMTLLRERGFVVNKLDFSPNNVAYL